MTTLRPLLSFWPVPALLFLILLSACAPPAVSGPSTALKEQLQLILQQQRQQAGQIQALQQQLTQVQQQVTGETQVSEKIEAQLAPSKAEEQPGPATAPVIPATASQEITALTASASSYLAAFTDLASGRYAAAETGFQNFLKKFPDHQYTANARFWLANAQSAQGKLQLAADNLRQLLSDPKGRAKAPAALLKLAEIYRQQGQDTQADKTIEQLRSTYPDSPEAQHFDRSETPQ